MWQAAAEAWQAAAAAQQAAAAAQQAAAEAWQAAAAAWQAAAAAWQAAAAAWQAVGAAASQKSCEMLDPGRVPAGAAAEGRREGVDATSAQLRRKSSVNSLILGGFLPVLRPTLRVAGRHCGVAGRHVERTSARCRRDVGATSAQLRRKSSVKCLFLGAFLPVRRPTVSPKIPIAEPLYKTNTKRTFP